MATKLKHIEQYKHNLKFLKSFPNSEFLDWTITVRFYCAVHMIEAILAGEKGEHSISHKERNEKIETIDTNREITAEYLDLYQLSKKARYECITITRQDAIDALDDLVAVKEFSVQKKLPMEE